MPRVLCYIIIAKLKYKEDSKMGEKLINCKVCGREIAMSAKICPHCGKRNKKPVLKIILISAAVLIVLSIIGNMPKTKTADGIANTSGSEATVAKSNSAGIWELGEYDDQFGNKTGEKFVTTKSLIRGKFSNPATENSDLDVQFIYSEKNGATIQLYEYGKQLGMPATGIGLEKVTIAVQDGKGQQYSFTGEMSQTWVYFDLNDRETVKQILLTGGNIKFRITIATVGLRSSYSFDITNANGFDVACQQL
jgi:hypothetical protein